MKKTYPTTSKGQSVGGWKKHLTKEEKRVVNKGTRKVLKKKDKEDN